MKMIGPDTSLCGRAGRQAGMKKLGIVLLIIIIAIGGSLYYLWIQATHLPDWYRTGPDGADKRSVIIYGKDMAAIRNDLEQKIGNQAAEAGTGNRQVEIALNERDANKLLASIVSDNAEKHEYLKTIKASKISIKNGKLDLGLVVNASDTWAGIAGHALEADGPDVNHVPGFLEGKQVYLGIAGKYGLKNGQFTWDEDGKIRIGTLTFSLKTILKRLGVSEERLKKTMKEIKFGRFKINNMETIKNTLLLKGSM